MVSAKRAIHIIDIIGMESSMESIDQDIKSGQFSHIYLLYGDEAYLRQVYKNKLKNALAGQGDTMNCNVYEGKNINPNEIIDLAETLPFLAERRLILIENSGFFKSGCEELSNYLTAVAPDTYFVFVETEVDKRSRMFKAVKDKGRPVEMVTLEERKLKNWAGAILRREGKNIRESTMELLLTKTGNDMCNIEKELEKLVSYTYGRDVVTDEDVEAICTTRITNQIFEMINAISEKKQRRALELYYDLLSLKEPPMRILFLIARQFNLLMQVKSLNGKTNDTKVIGEKTGLNSFIVSKYIRAAKSFSIQTLRNAVEDCVNAEEDVKTGRINDRMSVELLIVKYTS